METEGNFQNGDEERPKHAKAFGIQLDETVGHCRQGYLGGAWISGIKTGGRKEQEGNTAMVQRRGEETELLMSWGCRENNHLEDIQLQNHWDSFNGCGN